MTPCDETQGDRSEIIHRKDSTTAHPAAQTQGGQGTHLGAGVGARGIRGPVEEAACGGRQRWQLRSAATATSSTGGRTASVTGSSSAPSTRPRRTRLQSKKANLTVFI